MIYILVQHRDVNNFLGLGGLLNDKDKRDAIQLRVEGAEAKNFLQNPIGVREQIKIMYYTRIG